MTDGPRRTAAQRTGQLAEATFGKAVIGQGMLWHPTSAGNDFGIDGKVEIIEDETVRGAEFNVQIKGSSARGPFDETVSLGLVKVSTLVYWTSKLAPTLLVVHDESSDRLYCGWLHEIITPIDIADYQRKGQKRIRLSMPARRLNRRSWQAIRAEAQGAHEAVFTMLEHAPVRSFYNLLYCHTADVTDVLTDVVTEIAYCSPMTLALHFINATEPTEEQITELTERFARDQLTPPVVTIHTSYQLIVMQIVALDHELQAFLVGAFMFDGDNPIVRITESVQRSLRSVIDEFIPEVYGAPAEGSGVSLRAARMDLVKLVYGVGSILVLLRDYQRELRPFLFPIWGRLEWPVRDDREQHELPFSSKVIASIAYTSCRRSGEQHARHPSDKRHGRYCRGSERRRRRGGRLCLLKRRPPLHRVV